MNNDRTYRTCNKYDILIFLLIATTAFGDIGGFMQVTRLATILFFPFALINYRKCSFAHRYGTFVLIFWFFCGVSLVWTPDTQEGIKQLFYFIVHLTLFLEIVIFARFAKAPIRSIASGWLTAALMTLAVAVWELTTDNHLVWSKFDEARTLNTGTEILIRHFAAVTFYNFNAYVTYLCFALPFLLFGLLTSQETGRLRRFMIITAVVLTFVVILFNASRGGLISGILMLLILFLGIRGGKGARWPIFLAIFVFLLVMYFYGNEILYIISIRANSDNLLSGETRYVIWEHVWEAFLSTGGLGVGIGGISAAVSKFTTGITVPHNLFLEILVEFGVFFFLAFLVFLIKLFLAGKQSTDKNLKITIYMALLALPVYGIINSLYLLNTFVYASFASLLVFVNIKRIRS